LEQRTVNRRYRIDRRVGEGRMAIVYLGHDLLLDRPIAVKALRPEFAADRAAREQFGLIAAGAAGFSHPNIVTTIDIGEVAGTPFVVMEYVAAETLQEVIANEGPFGPDDVAGLLEQVASALDYIHERGVAHRNLSSLNILIEPSGVARLINIGLGRGTPDLVLFRPGAPLAPAHFMSPEEANGLSPTPSSDIYALGVIAYTMLSGTPPFQADSAATLAMQHIHQAPQPPSQRFGGIPERVDGIVLRALEKDPSRRFTTAGAFARAIQAWNAEERHTDDRSNGIENEVGDSEDVPAGGIRGLRRRMSRLVGLSLALGSGCGISGLMM